MGLTRGFVTQTLKRGGDFPAEVVEPIADRNLGSTLGFADGDRISFEMEPTLGRPLPS